MADTLPVTMLRGERARELCRVLLAALEPVMPADVRVVIRGKRKRVYLTAVSHDEGFETVSPGDPRHEQLRREMKRHAPADPQEPIVLGPGGSFSLDYGPGGFGSPLPFLTRGQSAKFAMISAVESIKNVIANADHPDWPRRGAKVKAKRHGDQVSIWFESDDGITVDVGSFAVSIAAP
jgi:hypothetical protein